MPIDKLASPHNRITDLNRCILQKYCHNHILNDFEVRIISTLLFLSYENIFLISLSDLRICSQMHFYNCKESLRFLEHQKFIKTLRKTNKKYQSQQIQLNLDSIAIKKCQEAYLLYRQEYQGLILKINQVIADENK